MFGYVGFVTRHKGFSIPLLYFTCLRWRILSTPISVSLSHIYMTSIACHYPSEESVEIFRDGRPRTDLDILGLRSLPTNYLLKERSHTHSIGTCKIFYQSSRGR